MKVSVVKADNYNIETSCLGIFRTFGQSMEIFMGSLLAGDNATAPGFKGGQGKLDTRNYVDDKVKISPDRSRRNFFGTRAELAGRVPFFGIHHAKGQHHAIPNLERHPFLYLKTMGKAVHHTGNLAQPRNVSIGYISHMRFPVKR